MAGTGWILAYDSGGRIACRAGAALLSTTPVSEVRDGRWHHFALTRDRDEVRLYLDGRLHAAGRPSRDRHRGGAVARDAQRQHRRPVQPRSRRRDRIYDRPLTAADIRQRTALGK